MQVFLKILLYGKAGCGKTTAACRANFGQDVLFLLTETNGLLTIQREGPDIHVGEISDHHDLMHIQAQLVKDMSDHGGKLRYNTVVLDSLDDLQGIFVNQILTQGGRGAMQIADWGTLKDKTVEMVRWLRDLPCNVVIITHADENGGEQDERLIRPQFMGRASQDLVAQQCNVVMYAYKRGVDGGISYEMLTESTNRVMTKHLPGIPQTLGSGDPVWASLFDGEKLAELQRREGERVRAERQAVMEGGVVVQAQVEAQPEIPAPELDPEHEPAVVEALPEVAELPEVETASELPDEPAQESEVEEDQPAFPEPAVADDELPEPEPAVADDELPEPEPVKAKPASKRKPAAGKGGGKKK